MHPKKITQILSDQEMLVECIIVARVQLRTSKGITDLLLPQTSMRLPRIVPLRSASDLRSDH